MAILVTRSRNRLQNLDLIEQASALGASVGAGRLYSLTSDHTLHYVDSTGADIQLGAGGGSGVTALTGDVTASGTGSVAAAVALVSGQTAANVAGATAKVNAASTLGYVLTANGSAAGASYQPASGSYQLAVCQCGAFQRQQSGAYGLNVGIALSQDIVYTVPPGVTGRIVALSGTVSADVATGTAVFSIYKNAVQTLIVTSTISLTISAQAFSATGSVAVVPGDQIFIAINSSSATPKVTCTVSALIAVP